MAEERVVLTAELKDQMSAPLETATKRVEGFTRTVEQGAKKQAAATDRSATAVTGSIGRQNRLFSGMTGVVGRATNGTARLFGTMSDRIT
jgi:signal transduction histidine kinase